MFCWNVRNLSVPPPMLCQCQTTDVEISFSPYFVNATFCHCDGPLLKHLRYGFENTDLRVSICLFICLIIFDLDIFLMHLNTLLCALRWLGCDFAIRPRQHNIMLPGVRPHLYSANSLLGGRYRKEEPAEGSHREGDRTRSPEKEKWLHFYERFFEICASSQLFLPGRVLLHGVMAVDIWYS